jgi:branched-chain amino acid transport system ATP-binding protein
MTILEVNDVTKRFRGLTAVNKVTFEVNNGEIVGLIGPNGAGKTTLFNVISGVYKPNSGKVIYKGEDISGLKPNVIAGKGLVRTWQSTILFKDESVLDNVLIGSHLAAKTSGWANLLPSIGGRGNQGEIAKKAHQILEFMGLMALKDELAKNLPHGYQRALGISIALAANPKTLLLDEPVTGMNPQETLVMMGLIKKIREDLKITVVIVEHDMKVIMGICDRIVVISYGRKIAEGLPEEIRRNKEVIEAYLGPEGQ